MNNKYRILIFAPAFAPFANPESIVNSKLALAFLEVGWEMEVISRNLSVESKYNYGSEWVDPWLPLKELTHVIRYPSERVAPRLYQILRGALKIRYLIDGCRWASYALDLGLKLHRQKPFNLVISRSGPDSAHLAAMAFAQRTGISWIANWNDPTGGKAPEPYGRGLTGKTGLIYEHFLMKVKNEVDWITFPSDRLMNYVSMYLGTEILKKCTVIPHAAISSISMENHTRNDIFTLCHAGNLSKERNPKAFLEALATFVRQRGLNNGMKFNIIGIENVGIGELVCEYGLHDNVVLKGRLAYNETLSEIYRSDVAVVLEASSEESIFLPSKFIDYIQVGRPILAVSPKIGTLKDIISRHGGGIVVDCESVDNITQGLDKLYDAWKDRTIEAIYGSDRLFPLYSPMKIAGQYAILFENLGIKQV